VATKSVRLSVASTGSLCQTKRPVAAKLFEIDGQASANSTSVSRSTTLLASSCSITVPSAIRISENDAIRSGLGCKARASVSTWPAQFERPPCAKTTLMVGRASVTSAISMRPIKNGKKRRRTATSPTGSMPRSGKKRMSGSSPAMTRRASESDGGSER
jgi:hypothetical protein